MTEEHKKKISEAHKKSKKVQKHIYELNKNFHVGRKRTEKTKQLQSLNSFQKGKSWEEAYGIDRASSMKELLRSARLKQRLPLKATSIELAVWNELENRNIKFEKNKSILNLTKPDAFIEPNICIYADGDYWHNLPSYIERDAKQNKILVENGYKVFRFWQHEINKDVKSCIDRIGSR